MTKSGLMRRGYQDGGLGSRFEGGLSSPYAGEVFERMMTPRRERPDYITDPDSIAKYDELEQKLVDNDMAKLLIFLRDDYDFANTPVGQRIIAGLRPKSVSDIKRLMEAQEIVSRGVFTEGTPGTGEGLMVDEPQQTQVATNWSTRAAEEARARGESLGSSRGSREVYEASDVNRAGVQDGVLGNNTSGVDAIPANLEGVPAEEYQAAKAFVDNHRLGGVSPEGLQTLMRQIQSRQEINSRADRFGVMPAVAMQEGGSVQRPAQYTIESTDRGPKVTGPDIAAYYDGMSREELLRHADLIRVMGYDSADYARHRDIIYGRLSQIAGMDEGGLMRRAQRLPNLDALARDKMILDRYNEYSRPLTDTSVRDPRSAMPEDKQEMFGRALLDFIPGVGDALGIADAVETVRDPEADTMAKAAALGLASLGLVPLVGDAVAAPTRAAMRQADALRIQDNIADTTTDAYARARQALDYPSAAQREQLQYAADVSGANTPPGFFLDPANYPLSKPRAAAPTPTTSPAPAPSRPAEAGGSNRFINSLRRNQDEGLANPPKQEVSSPSARRPAGEIDKDELEYLVDEWSRGNLSDRELRLQASDLGVHVKGSSLTPDADVENIIFGLPDGRVVRGFDKI